MRLVLLLIFCLNCSGAFAQEPNYVHYTMENGLTSDVVFKIQQTKDHLIWIGNHHAVSTFDGNNFNHFTNSKGFPFVSVLDIHEEDNGKILFSPPYYYPIEYTPATETFEPIRFDSIYLKRFYSNEKASVVRDQNGNIKVGFVRRGGSCTIYRDSVVDYHSDSTRNGIQLELHPNGLLYFEHPIEGTSVYLGDKEFKNALHSSKGWHLNAVMLDTSTFLVSLDKQLLLFEDGKLSSTKKFSHNIISLDADTAKSFWVNFYEHGTQKHFINNSELVAGAHFLKDYSITSVLIDHEGGHWFGTLRDGMFYTPELSTTYWDEKRGLPDHSIDMLSGNGYKEVLVGFSNNSLGVFQDGQLSQLLPLDAQRPMGEGLLRIKEVAFDKKNKRYWLVTDDLFIYQNGKTSALNVPFNKCLSLHFHQNTNTLWIGGRKNLTYLQPNGKFGPVLKTDFINDIGTDLNDNLFFLSRHGVMKLAPDSLSLLFIDSLRGKATYKIEQWENSRALLSAREGTTLWSEFGRHIFTSENSYHNSLYKKGPYLWASTGNGSDKIDLRHPEASPYHFSFEHGILEVNHGAIHIQNNTLWIGAGRGLYALDLSKIKPLPIDAPQILKVVGKDSTYKHLGNPLKLPHQQSNLTFHFKTITFKHQGQFYYEYRLSPDMKDFVASNSNEVSFNGLKSGTHTFELRAVTNNGSYSPISSWSLRIATPFWETWWFRLILALVVMAMGFLIFRSIIQRARRKAAQKAETEALIHSLRLQSIHAQFNPHFTFNALNSIQQQITPTSIEQAKEYLSKFANVMRSILVNSKKELIPLQIELAMITSYLELEQLRFGDRLHFTIDVDDDILPDYEQVPPMLFQPLVENAIKHGIFNRKEGGFLSIHFAVANNILTCTIEDNGIGRKEAKLIQQHKKTPSFGKGIELVKNRLMLVNSSIEDDFNIIDLYDTDGKALGTRIIVKLSSQ